MKRINVQDILDEANSYFHFTDESNLYDTEQGVGILNGGLSSIPRDRPHAVGDDKKNPCIYFVQGYSGILELMDVWIRCEYSELVMKENYSPGHIRIDEEGMKKAYQIWYEKLKNAKYLKLELKPGNNPKTSDFNPNEEDFKKKIYFRQSIYHDEDAFDNQFAKWNYGVNTDYSVATMDRWNMTTHLNHEGEKVIPPDKIKIIQDSRGRTDALSVILEIYEKYRDTVSNVDDLDKFMQYVIEKEMEYQGMKAQTIESEISNWENENFLAKVSNELNQYVSRLDKILYKRYKERINDLSPDDKERAMKSLKAKKLMNDNMDFVEDPNIVKLDKEAQVANGGFYKGKILLNPNSAKQFYAAYTDFSNGITDGIREFDYNQPLSKLENLSSLEILYWYYINGKTYQDFLKSTMLHEDVHRWTLGADIFDSPIETFFIEGLVETESREVAKENNIEYANCFRSDEVNLIDYLNKYNIIDRTSMMLCYNSTTCLLGMIGMVIRGKMNGIESKDLANLNKQIYMEIASIVGPNKNNNIGKNYREIFANIKPNKSYQIIEVIKNTIDREKSKNMLKSAIEATEQFTRTEEINNPIPILPKENQQEKCEQEKTQSE